MCTHPASALHCTIEGDFICTYCLLCWHTVEEQSIASIFDEVYQEEVIRATLLAPTQPERRAA